MQRVAVFNICKSAIFSIIPKGFYGLEEVERGQVIFRLWGGPAFLFTVLLIHTLKPGVNAMPALWCAAIYCTLGVSWLYFISIFKVPTNFRRLLIIFLDLIIWSVGLSFAGELYALTLWVPLTVSLGNGLRYSPKYGFISAFVSGICVAVALILSPYWRGLPLVAIGIFLTVTVVPLYTFLLSRRIVVSRRLMELRAAELEKALNHDALTGVLNRTGFASEFERVFAYTQESGHLSALLVIDLDGFKTVNDVAGHGTGDDVLRRVAESVRSCLRMSDSLARLGGDEFVVVLNWLQSPEDASAVAEKITEAVAAIHVDSYPDLRVGASIGICLLPTRGISTAEGALAAADSLMYASKKSGKGRVTTNRDMRQPESSGNGVLSNVSGY